MAIEITGKVVDRQSGRGIENARVEAWVTGRTDGQPIATAGTTAGGNFTFQLDERRLAELFRGRPVEAFFKVYLQNVGSPLLSTDGTLVWKQAERTGDIVLKVDVDAITFSVEGTVASANSAAVGKLRVQIVDRMVGDPVERANASTNENGEYRATFIDTGLQQRGKTKPDLQARVLVGDAVLGVSDIRYNADNRVILNVLLEQKVSTVLKSEYETLTDALSNHFKDKLADLQETDDRPDITYLANKSGWDARAVALTALAHQFSARTNDATGTPAIPQAFFYALFRAGVPANEDALYQTSTKTVESAWKRAVEQGVIPRSSADQIPNLMKRFQSLSADKLLTRPAPVGSSSLMDMLKISGLSDPQQKTFAQLYIENQDDMKAFWAAVGSTLGNETKDRLQVDGKLGALTLNNAPLMQTVHRRADGNRLTDPLLLAQKGYHRADPWTQLLTEDIPIPKEIPGDTLDAKRVRYAEYLAAQVRVSYPTAAVAQMVKAGDVRIPGEPDGASEQVYQFFTKHQGKFEIGNQPVERFIAQNKLVVPNETVEQVKRLQRVYQITPSDQAMSGLMKRGIHAASHVVRYDRETFVRTFAKDMGGAVQAETTYDRSVQVHNTVLNIAINYLQARTAPAIGNHGAPNVLDPAPANAGDVIAYATLEKLFGSMDFCACDHCRSILSPAAYLTDLLLFLHADEVEWKAFCVRWREDHEQAPYPFVNQAAWTAAQQPTDTEISPLNVLLARRPDVEHLPLTCENTNTALPYIDVVNETLEYFIANDVKNLSLTDPNRTGKDYKGHDTGDAASEDLLASPQFVTESAYGTLLKEPFPVQLPFHQPLENLRRYFNKCEVRLPLAMERLRKTDDLERGGNPYGWRDILMEEIGLSRAEYEILTDVNTPPLWRMYGFKNGTADADVIGTLSNAKDFAHRVGITYEDLISIIKTRFINPESHLIPKLKRLGVRFSALKALKDGTLAQADFEKLLTGLAVQPNPAAYGGNITAWVKDDTNYARIMGLIVLTGTDPANDSETCDFGKLELRFAKPMGNAGDTSTRLDVPAYVRLIRFIRLWKKLGWTIEQVDAAICALYRDDFGPIGAIHINDVTKLNKGFLTLLPRLGIVLQVMKALNLTVKRDLLSLLACWSEIGTHGDGALYRQMFLNPALLEQDPVFADNGYGEFLHNKAEKLLAHSEALRSAFNLSGDEFDLIVDALGLNTVVDTAYTHQQPALEQSILNAGPRVRYEHKQNRLSYRGLLSSTTRDALKAVAGVSTEFQAAVDALYSANQAALKSLTLMDISKIFRHGWLARNLKLSVREFLLLIQLTGLDPFTAPAVTTPAIMQLIQLLQLIKSRGLKVSAALYLIWNHDLGGRSAPDPVQITDLAQNLRRDFAGIDDQFSVIEDPNGDVARARIALVYGQEISDTFFALLDDRDDWDDRLVLDVTYTHPAADLENEITVAAPKLRYDAFRHRLSHGGLVSNGLRVSLKGIAGVSADFKNAVDALFNRGEEVKGLFFTRYPELQPPYAIAIAKPPAERHGAFLASFQPQLSGMRKRQQALQRIAATAGTDVSFAQDLLGALSNPHPLHAMGDPNKPALDDVLALETQGLTVQSIQGNVVSGLWNGHIEAPESGFYNFIIEADSGSTVFLTLDGQTRELTQNGSAWRNKGTVELQAAVLYPIELKVEKYKGPLTLKWETPKRPQEVIPPRFLYPLMILSSFTLLYARFLKAASLATHLGLTATEMVYFACHADYRINGQGKIDPTGDGWLNVLPNATWPADAAVARNLNAALLIPLDALLHFSRIKGEVNPSDESLLTILKDPTAAAVNAESQLFVITRWSQTSLNDMLAHSGGTIGGLEHFNFFRRVYDAFALVEKTGISLKALIEATTNDPSNQTVRNMQAALRARYDPARWRDVVRPINDEMRSLQRDALVAYILHQMRSVTESEHINTPNKLFEYFLMDVQMDPCMQTSRIRHALSSVQLFIERCLMNLEPRVSPASINTKQWTWMKRYRVWEANRKVFLFPENWLEPELRDDKSPFFKEIESELLQTDITEDSASAALLNYLSKLEEVAKLEPCGLHHIPADIARDTSEVNHVVARTAGASRKYYYRRQENGSWTPWEHIKLDIEDNPVIPVVWKDRLFLFWLRILKQMPVDMPPSKGSSDGDDAPKLGGMTLAALKANAGSTAEKLKMNVQAILCWSEHYNGKWQPTKTSNINSPIELGESGPVSFDRSTLKLAHMVEQEATTEMLRIGVGSVRLTGQTVQLPFVETKGYNAYDFKWLGSFLFYNTHSSPIPMREHLSKFPLNSFYRVSLASEQLGFSYVTPANITKRVILPSVKQNKMVEQSKIPRDNWYSPFFYEDSRHVFFVTTRESLVDIPAWMAFGTSVTARNQDGVNIPPLALNLDQSLKNRLSSLQTSSNGLNSGREHGSLERFVTEDAYIRRTMNTDQVVAFGDKQIGPSGAIR